MRLENDGLLNDRTELLIGVFVTTRFCAFSELVAGLDSSTKASGDRAKNRYGCIRREAIPELLSIDCCPMLGSYRVLI